MFAKNENMDLEKMIKEAWGNRELLKDETYCNAVRDVIEQSGQGNCFVQPNPYTVMRYGK